MQLSNYYFAKHCGWVADQRNEELIIAIVALFVISQESRFLLLWRVKRIRERERESIHCQNDLIDSQPTDITSRILVDKQQ